MKNNISIYRLSIPLLFILLLPALYGGCGSSGGSQAAIQVLGQFPQGEKIFFIRGRNTIYTIRPNGSDITPVAKSRYFISGMMPSPKGDKLVVVISEPDTELTTYSHYHLWLIEDGNIRQLTSGWENDFVTDWSGNGEEIYFSRNRKSLVNGILVRGSGEIWKMNLITAKETALTATDNVEEGLPCLSPDGKRVAFSVLSSIGNGYIYKDLYIMDADGNNRRLFIEKGYFCKWSPSGVKVAFLRKDNEPPEDKGSLFFNGTNYIYYDGNIYTASTDGTDIKKITRNGWVWTDPSWSPDGTKFVYSKETLHLDGPPTFEVWVVNADGTNPIRLTSGYNDMPAFWSR